MPALDRDTSRLWTRLWSGSAGTPLQRWENWLFFFLSLEFPRCVSMSWWLKAVLAAGTSQRERGGRRSMLLLAIKNNCWRKIQEQRNHKVLLVALNKKKNRLGKHFCLLIGPVAVATVWHHVIINRCLIRLAVHGKVLIKRSRSPVHTSVGLQLVASYGLLSMFTMCQGDGRQACCYSEGSKSEVREGEAGWG